MTNLSAKIIQIFKFETLFHQYTKLTQVSQFLLSNLLISIYAGDFYSMKKIMYSSRLTKSIWLQQLTN